MNPNFNIAIGWINKDGEDTSQALSYQNPNFRKGEKDEEGVDDTNPIKTKLITQKRINRVISE